MNRDGSQLLVGSIHNGRMELLWVASVLLLACGAVLARNLVRGRPGRAMQMIRDHELAAGVMGVDVARWKAVAFVISSMYAGAAGVLLAVYLGNPTPETFGLGMSISYLAMIVVGGMGSIAGSILGAMLVAGLPLVLLQAAPSLPLLAEPGAATGLDPGTASIFVYGAAVVLILMTEPLGLAGLVGRAVQAVRSPRSGRTPRTPSRRTPSHRPGGAAVPTDDDTLRNQPTERSSRT